MVGMKTILVVLVAALTLAVPVIAADDSDVTQALLFGVHYHVASHVVPQYSYDKDYSYLLAYEYHNASAYWQLAVGYAPKVSGTNNVDYLFTPQINLIFKDGYIRGGVGVLWDYREFNDESTSAKSSKWTDAYWQLLLGVGLPLGKITIDFFATYPFHDFDSFDNFKAEDIEYGGWIGFTF